MFYDTNIPLAYVFSIEPNHKKSKYIFNEYDEVYWSQIVKIEFNNRFDKKFQSLIEFYQMLYFEFKNSIKNFIIFTDIKFYLKNKKYESKEEEDLFESLSLFWNYYF